MFDAHDQAKVDLGSLYIYPQQGTVQIIQLIEVSPPTPNKLSSSPYPASFVTSSQSSEYSSESEYSEHSSDADVCSSFCSSEDPQEHLDSLRCDDEGAPRPDETYDIRATRVHSWRKQFADDMICGTYINLPTLLSLIDPLCIEALPALSIRNMHTQIWHSQRACAFAQIWTPRYHIHNMHPGTFTMKYSNQT